MLADRRSGAAYERVKRVLDAVLAAVALFVSAPLLLVAALAIRCDSSGAVLFRQVRIGRNNRRFTCLKLRTMFADAPDRGSWRTADHDPRITRVGRWLRRTSIDELPQFWNVLTGAMSLVGPRPMVPQQVADWTEADLARRHSVRPGLSGWAQVHGRSALGAADSDRLDLEYCDRISFGLDLRILYQTIAVVISGSGSN